MKQSEIQTIITTTPDAVFNSNVKYNGMFIITGFVKEARTRHGAESWYALTQQVYFNEKTQTTSISTSVQKKALRIVTGVFSNSVADYNAYKIERLNATAKAKILRAQNIDAMNEIKPQLVRVLKALNIDNNARNYSDEQKFTIEVNLDNAEALLALLNTIAAEQVK
jgi:hypothetical protein